MSANQSTGATSLTGIFQVKVFFDPMGDLFTNLAKGLLNPDGYHYIKLSAKTSEITKVEFCDANGNISGLNPGNPPSSMAISTMPLPSIIGKTKCPWP